jgi:hypothetical protein
MALTPNPCENQTWRFVNQPLASGIILLALSAILAGVFRISSQLNDLSDKQREGLIEVKNLTVRVERLEGIAEKHEKDILVINYERTQGR